VSTGALIDEIKKSGLVGTCPDCENVFSTKRALLFDVREQVPKGLEAVFIRREARLAEAIRRLKAKVKKAEERTRKKEVERNRLRQKYKKMPFQIKYTTKKTTYGQVLEKIFPSTRGFKMNLNDCRAVFRPIDYLSFNGHSQGGAIEEITFLEIKTGEKGLDKKQRSIKEAVEGRKMGIETYRLK